MRMHIMRIHKKYFLILIAAALLMAGCGGVKKEVRETVLEIVAEAGYVGEDDVLEHECVNVTDALPKIKSYDYVYNTGESLYSIRIEVLNAEEDTTDFEVYVLYDVELVEYHPDDEDLRNFKVSSYNYDSQIDLLVDIKEKTCEGVK